MDKKEICFVRTKQRGGDYCFDAIQNMGYDILIPYKDRNLLLRCLREVWFRANLPYRKIWFNSSLKSKMAKVYIVKDPLIVTDFLVWLKKLHPEARIILDYDNRVSMASIKPDTISNDLVEKWSYDADDCKAYGMNLKHGAYLDIYSVQSNDNKDIDVLYLGRDKGRAEMLLSFEKELNEMGLRTHFHICANRSFLKYKKKYYKPILPYLDYLELLKSSNAILNIVQPNQTSLTLREYEAIFNNVKCITNNIGIKSSELYHPSRYFVLGEDSIENLKEFLLVPFKVVGDEMLSKYTFDSMVEEMINRCEK